METFLLSISYPSSVWGHSVLNGGLVKKFRNRWGHAPFIDKHKDSLSPAPQPQTDTWPHLTHQIFLSESATLRGVMSSPRVNESWHTRKALAVANARQLQSRASVSDSKARVVPLPGYPCDVTMYVDSSAWCWEFLAWPGWFYTCHDDSLNYPTIFLNDSLFYLCWLVLVLGAKEFLHTIHSFIHSLIHSFIHSFIQGSYMLTVLV